MFYPEGSSPFAVGVNSLVVVGSQVSSDGGGLLSSSIVQGISSIVAMCSGALSALPQLKRLSHSKSRI